MSRKEIENLTVHVCLHNNNDDNGSRTYFEITRVDYFCMQMSCFLTSLFSLSLFIVHWIFLRWFVVVVVVVSLQNMYIIKIRTNVNDLSESNLMAVKIFLCTWLCDSLKKYQLLFLCESQWLRIYFFYIVNSAFAF